MPALSRFVVIAQAAWFLSSLSPITTYRPRDDLLTAALLRTTVLPASPLASGHRRNGSSTWHAIEYGLELLKQGVIWRDDLTEILRIQPSRRNEEDFVAWFPEKNGMFMVRSAYRLALHKQMMNQDRGATSSRPDGESPSWKLIWRCPVPPKIKVLAWKICRNAVATQLNMKKRDISKGKMVVDHHRGFKKNNGPVEDRKKAKMKWTRPGDNEVKLNVDGAFSWEDRAGIGMVLRDQQGEVIFTACRQLQTCRDATEAEIMAIEEGVILALQWTDLRLIVESDCSLAVELITGTNPHRSAYAFRINVIRELLRERGSRLVKISRDANRLAMD
ncbi:hypothetical protein QYE76_057645 [Lolium multiflorum]|uniref:RNase H type-1 domain-containing protein n=1 Tax=Lolium multiflorum TaxID=4521 RepID=A0AAD8T595_LOLMU|nr:hypothetical protein QYE76_057645 [Lolium multiflorum]